MFSLTADQRAAGLLPQSLHQLQQMHWRCDQTHRLLRVMAIVRRWCDRGSLLNLLPLRLRLLSPKPGRRYLRRFLFCCYIQHLCFKSPVGLVSGMLLVKKSSFKLRSPSPPRLLNISIDGTHLAILLMTKARTANLLCIHRLSLRSVQEKLATSISHSIRNV